VELNMFGEAKIALVLGVGMVIAGSVIFFHRDLVQATTPPDAIAPAKTETQDTDAKGTTRLRSSFARPISVPGPWMQTANAR
jgi:hypothetical protein